MKTTVIISEGELKHIIANHINKTMSGFPEMRDIKVIVKHLIPNEEPIEVHPEVTVSFDR